MLCIRVKTLIFYWIFCQELLRCERSHAFAELAIDLCVHVINGIVSRRLFLRLCIISRIIFLSCLNALQKFHEKIRKRKLNGTPGCLQDFSLRRQRLSLPGNCSFIFSIFMTISAPSFSKGLAFVLSAINAASVTTRKTT